MIRNMKKPKRIFALLILVVMVLTIGIPGITYAASISDIGGHWAYKDISTWIQQGLISGYPDGTFKPNKAIVRAEFYRLVNQSFKFTETEAISFTDVKQKDWFYPEVAKAKKAGYLIVDGNGNVNPKGDISRQEIAVIITKIKGLKEDESKADGYIDVKTFAASSKGSIGAVTKVKVMFGYKDKSFGATKSTTRAEAVTILSRALALKTVTIGAIADQSLVIGATGKVTVKPEPADAALTAKSSDDKIAAATVKGTDIELKGVAAGTAIITVAAEKEGFIDGSATFKVNVQAASSSSGGVSNPPSNPPTTTTNNPPTITVVEPDGNNDGIITLSLGTAFVAPTVTASDPEDGNITSRIVKVGENLVNVNAAGDYVLTYNVTDTKGLAAAEKRVTVKVTNTYAATANISVEVSNDMPMFKQITVNSSTTGVRFKAEGSLLIKSFTKSIAVSTNDTSKNVYILDIAGNVIGVVPVDVSKDNSKAYTFNALTMPMIDANVNINVDVATDLTTFKQIKINSSAVGVKFKVAGSSLIKPFSEVITVTTSDATKAVSILDADENVLGTVMVDVGSDNTKDYTFKFPKIENAIIDVIVDVAEDLSNFKQITVAASSAGASYKVEGSTLVKGFGEPISVTTSVSKCDVSILSGNGTVLGTVEIDISKDSTKVYMFKDVTTTPPPPVNTPPVLTVVEPDGVNDGVIILTVGAAFAAPSVTASDAENGNITSRIVKTGEAGVNTSVAGDYLLTYNVSDLQGLAATERKVTVKVIPASAKVVNIIVTVAPDLPMFKSIKVSLSSIGAKFKVEGSTLVKPIGETITISTSAATRVVTILDVNSIALGTVTVSVGSNSTQDYVIQ